MSFLTPYFQQHYDFVFENQFKDADSFSDEDKKKWLNEKYNILFGFYTILDSNEDVHNLVSTDYDKDNNDRQHFFDYPYTPITVYDNWITGGNVAKLHDTIAKKAPYLLSRGLNVPYYYRFFNFDKKIPHLHGLYSNTWISQRMYEDVQAQVVLAEEIVFFIYFKYFKDASKIEMIKSFLFAEIAQEDQEIQAQKIKFNFHQLVKYAASIAHKFNFGTLNGFLAEKTNRLGGYSYCQAYWNTEDEGKNRQAIDDICSHQENQDALLQKVDEILECLEKHFSEEPLFVGKERNEIIGLLARFDIDMLLGVWEIAEDKCMWDYVVYPIYKSSLFKHVLDAVQGIYDSITIDTPILLHCFIRPVFLITKGQIIDEKQETLFGFYLTNQVCCYMSKPIIEQIYLSGIVERKLYKANSKSAISRAMSRNMSHNIGSHVLSRLVQSSSLAASELLKGGQFYTRIGDSVPGESQERAIQRKLEALKQSDEYKELPEAYTGLLEGKARENPQNELLGYFLSYLKTRHDLLADIVSAVPQSQSAKFFKAELMEGIDKNTLLLNKISGVDDFAFRFGFEGLLKDEDRKVAVSNDIIGQHAFYILLENIIRNTAKHGQKNAGLGRGHVFTIGMEESRLDSAMYRITISDDMPVADIDGLVTYLNEWINQPILNPATSDLRQGALGLIEMEVCAAYLRRVPAEDIENPDFDIKFSDADIETHKRQVRAGAAKHNLLRAIKVPLPEGGDALGYRLYMPKPQELLILDAQGDLCRSALERGTPEDRFFGFKELESKGVLLLNAVNQAHNRDEEQGTARWHFDQAITYPHAILLVTEADGQSPAFDASKLPQRIGTLAKCGECFADFQKKHAERQAKNQYGIGFDIGDPEKTEMSLREIWRAYVFGLFEQKGLRLEFSRDHKLFPHFPENLPFFTPSFDLHGKNYADWAKNGKTEAKYKEIFESKFKGYVDQIQSSNDSPKNTMIKLRHLEAGLSNVLILDERIQEQSYASEYQMEGGPKIKYAQVWDHANVYIPETAELHLGAKDFEDGYTGTIKAIAIREFGTESPRKCKGLDFIVIHLGVIEKILERTPGKSKDSKEDISAFADGLAKAAGGRAAKVIVTSGRAPTNLPEDLPFLSYSVISQYLIEYRFKMFLIEVLNAARPKISAK